MVRLSIWPINDETIREPDMDISDPKHIIFLCLPYYISTSFVPTVNRQQLGIRSLSGRATSTSLVLVRLADMAFFFCKLFFSAISSYLDTWGLASQWDSVYYEQWAEAPETAYKSFLHI
jgi:hypothetical protein